MTVASASDSMLRGCRLEIPHGTEDDHERPCSTMDHTYVTSCRRSVSEI